MKLFVINLKGPIGNYDNCYVLADDPTQAYNDVKDFLDKEDIGEPTARVLDSIKVIADTDIFQDCYPYMHL